MNSMTSDSLYDELSNWLHRRSIQGWDVETLLTELVEKLNEAGLDLIRVHIGMPMLHPLFVAGSYSWSRGKGIVAETYDRGLEKSDAWLKSPVRETFLNGKEEARYQINGRDRDRFEIFSRFAAEGATDYIIQLTGFDDRKTNLIGQEGTIFSWTTNAPGGFDEKAVALLQRLRLPLSAEIKGLSQRRLVGDILRAYLGNYSTDRVLSGQIQRGDGDLIEAVILFCDLRQSSKLAERYGFQGFLEVLNDYYDITAGAVIAGGGEVLRYIGDASLAIFPFERYERDIDACDAALAVAHDAMKRAETINEDRKARGEPALEFGIGLHTGKVMYGNIGTKERIEFTVIGSAANEAARIEAKCKELSQTVLVSDAFAAIRPGNWHSHGTFELRNIGHPIEILSPLNLQQE
ncbi:adenylate/guanylate cyclase domain-containing protein [Thalassospira povalilytica]|uniref:Adenylate/guanylate cyclase domain-containing protein n=1 Tax=Thalassospira povalilytica TaxID=732237 RepID=A0A8I1M7F6_9PROT|nr:adenylate/guanylate cyclase domain-containing protein [Thalassospira povalilytica]MBN8196326.1 adenylate/guanylate cyclase domain-containing protein [Thalassospira povalilytica]